MTDTVDTYTRHDGLRNHTVALLNSSDGTGESEVVKVDISSLVGPDAQNAPTSMSIKEVQYDIQGFTSVDILFDATTPEPGLHLSGQGFLEFPNGIHDPKATGTTGDIKLTTNGAIAGASYTIDLRLIKHA